jgi:hypothetical protein
VTNYTLISLNDIPQAIARANEVMRAALENRSFVPLITILPSIALLCIQQSTIEQAIELYTLALKYPYVANSQWFDDVAGKEIQAAADALPPDRAAAAQERGRQRDLWQTAAELLAQFTNPVT